MGRSRSFDPSECLDKVIEIFWAQGFEATSIDDIVTATGVNRASLYSTFGDKHALFVAALKRYGFVDPEADFGVFGRASEITTVKGALRAWFERKAELAGDPNKRGCLMTNTVTEMGTRDPEIRTMVQEHMARTENAIDALLRHGQSTGEVSASADIRARARHLVTTMQGFQVMAKINSDSRALAQIAEEAVTAATA